MKVEVLLWERDRGVLSQVGLLHQLDLHLLTLDLCLQHLQPLVVLLMKLLHLLVRQVGIRGCRGERQAWVNGRYGRDVLRSSMGHVQHALVEHGLVLALLHQLPALHLVQLGLQLVDLVFILLEQHVVASSLSRNEGSSQI